MVDVIKPVRYGILIGLFGLIFGIGWAFWLVLGHERIHQSLEKRAAQAAALERNGEKGIKAAGHEDTRSHTEEGKTPEKIAVHVHKNGVRHRHDIEESGMAEAVSSAAAGHEEAKPHLHDNPVMELSHTRLVRGHLHAMGLGLVALAVSLILAFTTAGGIIKTAVPMLTGLGGLIYPFAWIVMGYRTPSLGAEAAEASVMPIAGTGVALVLLGIFTAIGFLLKDMFSKKRR